jgi:putative ABC transport system permease protein
MSFFNELARRVRGRLGREPAANLGDEVRFHLDMEAQALERAGLSPDAARAEAHRKFGGVDRYTEELHDERGGRIVEWLGKDARYAFRIARRFPAFTAIVLLTLGIAIGANTAIFSVVDTVLLRPLPFPQGDRLVLLYAQNPDKSIIRFSVSYADYLDWRKQTKGFTDIAAFASSSLTFVAGDDAQRLSGMTVTSNFFDVLGARPRFGRLFHDGDAETETDNEVVLGNGFWQRQFGSDSTIVGRPMKIGSSVRTVIGILPPDFDLFGNTTDAITVLTPASIPNVESHGQHMLSVVGRLRPGVALAAAQQDLSAVAARLAEANPPIAGWNANVFLLRDELVRGLKNPLFVLLAAAGLVLLIGCINVANLLLTRSALREREVALRQALGASRVRLVSQLLVESALLAIGGALLGLIIAKLTLRVILRVAPTGLLPGTIGLHGRVLAFALGLAALTTIIVGLWPALSVTRLRLARSLRDGGRSSSGGVRTLRTRRSLVVAETSLALVLLICAGLVLQSLQRMLRVDPGFQPDHVVTMRVSLPGPRYNDTTQVQFFRDLQSRLEGRGGIDAVAAANTAPISAGGINAPIRLIGMPARAGEKLMGPATAITPGYFRTLGMRLVGGRDIAWSDAGPTLVVNESAARRYWPGQNAIGKHIAFGDRDTVGLEVVGIVSDAHARGLTTDAPAMIYMAYAGAARIARTMTIVARGRGDVGAVVATTKQAVREIDPALPLYNAQSVTQIIEQSMGQPRLNTILLSFFALVAVVLAVIGIYGVVSYSVTQRTQEIGVRMALGARQNDVLRLVLREGAALAAIGVAIGVVGAFVATPLIRSWLFGIERTDAPTIVVTAVGLVVTALAASYLPARRASKVDPLVAMRGD